MRAEIASVKSINIIKNERQLKSTQEQIARLKASLKRRPPKGAPKELVDATRGQTKELIEELEAEINLYNIMVTGLRDNAMIKIRTSTKWSTILRIPIVWRIFNELSIEAFAHLVQVHSRQIARYEKEGYQNAKAPTFLKIMREIGVQEVTVDFNVLAEEKKKTTRKAAGSRTPQQMRR